ncbi:MAG: acetate kinase [Candidatus Omnitrophota bacterium]|nr:acetate kinase [Candidatus Omnitrophota bacterium]
MLILVINCGSSSAKYRLFDVAKNRSLALRQSSSPIVSKVEPLAKGVVERIGQPGSCRDHHAAIAVIVDALTKGRSKVIGSKSEIRGVGHRVVHGGEEFKESTLLNEKVIRSIEKYSELAPLHNPPSLSGIRASYEILKGIPQVAVFDTSFHQTMPQAAFLYGLPFKYYEKYRVRRYGFHGTSHRFVSEEAAKVLRRPLKSLKLITCHLGNGCSMAAVSGGRSVDTSMGFTPLEGLLMGTRSGDLDPAVVLYMMEKEGLTLSQVNDILNKDSGLLGVSGVSNDMRDMLRRVRVQGTGYRRCKLAIEIFIYRIKKYIGAYYAAMGGLDAVIFTAGIGENNPWIMKRIELELKGVVDGKTRFIIIPTNEELLIARDTYTIIKRGIK